ncbi:MAG TPA: substrate-binding domain-containing protein [Roseiarcus sp.]|jgi:ABC-type sugar transport system substrate-binding protein|nr:substrate-binding domain-containing protein [Roseiarcus sp.]
MRFTRRVVTASLLAMALSAPAFADDKPLILLSIPGMNFPFFVHMMKALKAESEKDGLSYTESDGQDQAPKQTADLEAALAKGVKGIVISPHSVDAMAPALQEAVDANVPVVTIDRRVPSVAGVLAHVGADNTKGGEAQGNLIVKMFPEGATIINLQGTPGASPAIDRNKGLHNVLDKAGDKYKIVAEQTANFHRDDGLKVTESLLAGLSAPPKVIVSANDDMALGAIEAVKGRNLKDIVIIGFDALPEALAKVRDGELTATVEQFPAKQSSLGVQILADFVKNGKKPAQQLNLITPVAITKDNLKDAERLGEVK